jgi:hypothetical protein
MPRRATWLCWPPCRSSSQASPGLKITLFSARSFLRSVQLPFSAQPGGTGPDMDQLILKRASASRPSGHWSEDDYDVLAESEVVGRIMKVIAAPESTPVDVDARLRASSRPLADARLRGHARGCDGRLRQELAAAIGLP